MDHDTSMLDDLLEAENKTIEMPTAPSSPPCNDFSESILSAPVPEDAEYDPGSPSIGTEYLLSVVHQLAKRVDVLENELKDHRAKYETRYQRHCDCITELQKRLHIGDKRQKTSTAQPLFVPQQPPYQYPYVYMQQLPLPDHTQNNSFVYLQPPQLDNDSRVYLQTDNHRVSRYPGTVATDTDSLMLSTNHQYTGLKESDVKSAIGVFLKLWNNVLRCGHYYRQRCKYTDKECTHFHENATHRVIATELRAVFRSGGALSASALFSSIEHKVNFESYNCREKLDIMKENINRLVKL